MKFIRKLGGVDWPGGQNETSVQVELKDLGHHHLG